MMSRLRTANLVALLLPLALLAGAWGSQLIGGLIPCEMCHWQRLPHYAAVVIAVLALMVRRGGGRAALVAVAALCIGVSGVIGVMHAGVEYHWWHGFTACTANAPLGGISAADRLDALLHAPIVRCDQAQWSLFGVSMAGYNAILSLGGAALILWLLRRVR